MSIYTEHFETIFGTRQNIQTLRDKVLELAVQGKLVEQDKNEEPASELIEIINNRRKMLFKKGKIKKQPWVEPIDEDEIPFDVPSKWEWVRLGEIADFIDYRGKTPKKTESGIPLITAKNIKLGFINENPKEFIHESDYDNWMTRGIPKYGNVIFTTEAPLGNVARLNIAGKYALAQRAIVFKTHEQEIDSFLFFALLSKVIRDSIFDKATGTTVLGIKASKLKKIVIPLPPITEQKRIIHKVEALMSEIDQLERYLERKERLKVAVPKAVISAISNCQNEEELKVQLGFVIEHFTEVFQTAESLQELRNVILQLGIQGKLVPQNPKDAPASELLKNIQAEKELLLKEKVIKKDKALVEIEEDEIPFEIPANWEWARLDTLTSLITKGTTPRGGRMAYIDNGIKFYRAENVNKVLSVNETKYVSLDIHESFLSRSILQENDLLITIAGTLGRSAIVKKENLPGNVNQAISIIRFVNPSSVNLDYFNYYFSSALVNHMLLSKTKVTAIPNLTLEIIANTLVSIPPLAEQQRIVNKIESLFAVIDKLEKEMNLEQRIVKAMATI